MWLTLLLPPLLLPALVGFSRFESRMLSGSAPRVEPSTPLARTSR